MASLANLSIGIDKKFMRNAKTAGLTTIHQRRINREMILEGVKFVDPFAPQFEIDQWV